MQEVLGFNYFIKKKNKKTTKPAEKITCNTQLLSEGVDGMACLIGGCYNRIVGRK